MDAIPEFRRDILVSVRPIYASKILHGQKTVELRRKFPEVGATGALILIYSSSPVSAVVGCARIKHVLKLPVSRIWKEYGVATQGLARWALPATHPPRLMKPPASRHYAGRKSEARSRPCR